MLLMNLQFGWGPVGTAHLCLPGDDSSTWGRGPGGWPGISRSLFMAGRGLSTRSAQHGVHGVLRTVRLPQHGGGLSETGRKQQVSGGPAALLLPRSVGCKQTLQPVQTPEEEN